MIRAISSLCLLFVTCQAGFFTQRNHTRRSYYEYLRNQIRPTTTTSPIMISTTTTSVPYSSSKSPILEISFEDDNILKVPDDIGHPPPGLGDATAFNNDNSDDIEDDTHDATGPREVPKEELDHSDKDATALNPRVSSLFNWKRMSGGYQSPPRRFSSVSGFSSSRLGKVGHGPRSMTSRLRSRPSRKQSGSGLPGVKYMVYTGELNNLNS